MGNPPSTDLYYSRDPTRADHPSADFCYSKDSPMEKLFNSRPLSCPKQASRLRSTGRMAHQEQRIPLQELRNQNRFR